MFNNSINSTIINTLKNKIVVIHIDALRREFSSSWILGEKLKLEGCKVILSSRHSTRRLLRFLTPDVFISTHVFLLSQAEYRNLESRGVKIYVNEVEGTIHESGQASTYPEEVNGETLDYSLFSGIFVWSIATLNWLIKYRHIDEKKIFIVGNIRLSKFITGVKSANSKVVGVISRFELINTFDNRHPFVNLSKIDPQDPQMRWYYERLSIDAEVFSISVKLIEGVLAHNLCVSMRPHPNENLDAYEILQERFGKKFIIDKSFTIDEWLSELHAVFGTTSSAFADCYAAKVPIISSELIQKFHYSRGSTGLDGFGLGAYHPQSIEEAVNICVDSNLSLRNSSEFDAHMKRFYSFGSEVDPIDSAIKAIKSTIGNEKKRILFLNYYYILIFLMMLDIFSVVRTLFSKKPMAAYRILRLYNFNRFIHWPNAFMKRKRKLI